MLTTLIKRKMSGQSGLITHSSLVDRLLSARGLTRDDLDCRLTGLPPPDGLPDIDRAAEIIVEAIDLDLKILVVGDYDADGATSTALIVETLFRFGATHVEYVVPDRQRHGYGLSPAVLEDWIEAKAGRNVPDLVITVDNGIAAVDGVAHAKSLGCQVVVTDHHLPGESLPNADALVCPTLPESTFPSTAIAGVGVAFYVMARVRQVMQKRGDNVPSLKPVLDLVAIGTVADVVPLDDTNRRLVAAGLSVIHSAQARPGIKAMFDGVRRQRNVATTQDIGFMIGPRLNAAGRIETMTLGIECLLADDMGRAVLAANRLELINAERKVIQARMLEGTHQLNAERPEDAAEWVVFDPDFHVGLIGIVAGKLRESWNRPVLALAANGAADEEGGISALDPQTVLRGSGRSVPGVHLRNVLDRINQSFPDVLLGFGGHAMAAGFSLRLEQLQRFRQAFAWAVAADRDSLTDELVIESDGELAPECQSVEVARQLESLMPWGTGCELPVFDGQVQVVERKALSNGLHWRLTVRPIDSGKEGRPPALIEAVWFGIGDDLPSDDTLHLAYHLKVNRFRGREAVQWLVIGGRPVGNKAEPDLQVNAPVAATSNMMALF